jgi:hypothetical protein
LRGKAASLYLKALILEVFEGDIIYGIAAFGKSPQEANIWKRVCPPTAPIFGTSSETRNSANKSRGFSRRESWRKIHENSD